MRRTVGQTRRRRGAAGLGLSIDGAFLTLYGLGCFLFLWIVFAGVTYETEGSFEDSNERAKT